MFFPPPELSMLLVNFLFGWTILRFLIGAFQFNVSYLKPKCRIQFWIAPIAQIVCVRPSVRVCLCVCFLIFIFCGPRRPRRPRLRQPVGAEEVARFFFRTSVKESKQINNDVKELESFEEPDESIFLQTTTGVGNLIYFGSSKY